MALPSTRYGSTCTMAPLPPATMPRHATLTRADGSEGRYYWLGTVVNPVLLDGLGAIRSSKVKPASSAANGTGVGYALKAPVLVGRSHPQRQRRSGWRNGALGPRNVRRRRDGRRVLHVRTLRSCAAKGDGIILGVEVLFDAALVRLLLLPVLLRLMGARAWYLPRWVRCILPDVRFGHS
jgi:hypothetical protein